MSSLRFALVFASCLWAAAGDAQPQLDPHLQALSGIKNVWVSFIYTEQPVKGSEVRDKIIAKLRSAGLTVISDAESFKSGAVPTLTLNLRIREDKKLQAYAVNARLELSDYVLLLRNGTKDFAITWTSEELTSPVPFSETTHIESALLGLVDQFIEHLNVANKK